MLNHYRQAKNCISKLLCWVLQFKALWRDLLMQPYIQVEALYSKWLTLN